MQTVTGMTARDEISLLMRFASVGAGVTALHFALAFGLVAWGGWAAQAANLTAFVLAFALSFVSHYRITFRSGRGYGPALMRFVVSAGGASAASAALLWVLETYTGLDAALCVVLAAAVIPLITYAAGRWWVF
jgi:putative flippase GtrA